MTQRGSWADEIAREAKVALTQARMTLEASKARAEAAGRRWTQEAQRRAETHLAEFGRGVSVSQKAAREAVKAIVQPERTPRPPIRVNVAPARGTAPKAPSPATPKPDIVKRAADAALQVDAAVRGAADVLTFGFADEISAGANAAFDFGDRSFGEKYADYHAAERARDRADMVQRPIARGTGQVAGLALSLMAPSSAAAVRASGPKLLSEMRGLKGVDGLPRIQVTGREYAVAAGGAGIFNGAAETATDIASGGQGGAGDYLGAVVGGAAAAPFAIARSPKSAGAVEGFTTSVAQDLFNGRPVSFDDAMRSSAAGARFSDVADSVGTRWATQQSSTAKGKLGEQLSIVKTRARGHVPNGRGQRLNLSKGYTILDPASSVDELAESKMGPFAKASANQYRAFLEHPDNYRWDWWQPSDIGKITGFGGASFGSHVADRDNGF